MAGTLSQLTLMLGLAQRLPGRLLAGPTPEDAVTRRAQLMSLLACQPPPNATLRAQIAAELERLGSGDRGAWGRP